MKSSPFELLRFSSEGAALSMHGPHQCAPTYSPNTACPGLVAYRGISFCFSCSRSSTLSSIAMKPVKDIMTTRAAKATG